MKEVSLYKNEADGKVLLDLDESSSYVRLQGLERLRANADWEEAKNHTIQVLQQDNRVVVRVGNPLHETDPEHYIQWVLLQTEVGISYRHLFPGSPPEVYFSESINEVKGMYAFCNKHGLWKAEASSFAQASSSDATHSYEFT